MVDQARLRHLTALVAGHADREQPPPAGLLERPEHVAGAAAGGDPEDHVARPAEGRHLTGVDDVETDVVREGGEHRHRAAETECR